MGRGLPASVGAAPSVRILSQLRVEARSELIGTFEGQGSESRACDTIWERLTGGSLGQDCPRASPPSCGALVGGGDQHPAQVCSAPGVLLRQEWPRDQIVVLSS